MMEHNKSGCINREIELDLLRLVACVVVVFAHCGLSYSKLSGINLIITKFANATILWAVPCFVMISGRFFLDPGREVNAKKLKASIFRIAVAFLFWNVVYQLLYVHLGVYNGLNWKGIIISGGALIGPYHFWFLWMLFQLYISVPFLRRFTDNKRLMELFIAIFIASEFLTIYGGSLPLVGESISKIVEDSYFGFFIGYTGYFLLGYYLRKYELSKKLRILLYFIGVGALVGTGMLRCLLPTEATYNNEAFNYLSTNVIVYSVALYEFFIVVVGKISIKDSMEKQIVRLSKYTYGIYLVHLLFVEVLSNTKFIKSFLWIEEYEVVMRPLRTLLVFTLSFLLIFIVRRIPKLGKLVT